MRVGFWIAVAASPLLIGLLFSSASDQPSSSSYKVLYAFTGSPDGANPQSDLTMDAAGNLYGTTANGGATSCQNGCGTVFELKRAKDGWREEVLYRFLGGSDGSSPVGVTFDSAGNLYGTTADNGQGVYGTVFELTPNSTGGWTKQVLFRFTGDNGINPDSDLVFDKHGNLYGATEYSGNLPGEVFELSPQSNGTWTEKTLHTFTGAPDGAIPGGALVIDAQGDLYGATMVGGTGKCSRWGAPAPGCGTVYELTRGSSGWTESIVYNFVLGNGLGNIPSGGLILNGPGNLYGATEDGGNGAGMVFKLSKSEKHGWQETVLSRFYFGRSGMEPLGRLAADAQDHIFGTTHLRGISDNGTGTVFRVNSSGPVTTLHRFAGGSDGAYPDGGVILDKQGVLYGTTTQGGSSACGGFGCGTVYQLKP